jgi:hypothetical protein
VQDLIEIFFAYESRPERELIPREGLGIGELYGEGEDKRDCRGFRRLGLAFQR